MCLPPVLLSPRSRTFSGPYVGSTLKDRFNLALFVAALVRGRARGEGKGGKGLRAGIHS